MITPSLSFLLLLFTVASAVPSFLNYSCITANNPASTTYLNNLNILLTNLTSNTQIDYGFYTSFFGHNTDTAYAIGMCRGDVNLNDCRSCLNDSRLLLTQICPNYQAVGWYEYCMLRYSNLSMLGRVADHPQFSLWNPYFISSKEFNQFNKSLNTLMDKLRIEASGGDYRRKYAFQNVTSGIQSYKGIFGLAQCTPDLSRQQCDDCLFGAFSEIQGCCNGRRGARVIKPSCNIRYEIYPFLTSTIDAFSPSNAPGKGSNTSRTTVIIVIIVVVAVAAAAASILVLSYVYVYLRKNFQTDESNEEIIADESLQFTFDTIRVATEDFSYSNKLGEGGFGSVYKGKLSNGQMIAVKRLSKDSGQGEMEFRNEVQLLAELQHQNLVKLLGFCLKGSERLLIYEFVPNKSLDYFLFDPTKCRQLDWINRFKIIEGVARALLYLHEDCKTRIIHRDLKPSNILLDEEMNAKLSDFGLARLFIVDQNQGKTSKIVGTYGYMAPEYAMYGQFSVKSDVFSFGVLVLEIVSGQKHNCTRRGDTLEELPLTFAWRSWMEGRAANIIDPSLSNSAENEILRCIHIGLLCVQENLVERPTMASIVLMLNSSSLSLPVPMEPAFFAGSRAKSPRVADKQSEEYILKGTNESTESLSYGAFSIVSSLNSVDLNRIL
nr:putative receptor-like protein kinase At4g00960 [Arachis hypogaea]